jgi:glycosyltransferase involved in cell wall biosynthesis
LRILYFSRDYSPHDRRFLSALAESEHEVDYLRLERSEPAREKRPVPEGIGVIDWWGGRRRMRSIDWPRAGWEVRRELRRLSPDVVHAGPVQSCALLAAMAGGHPLLTMSWGSDLLRDARRGWGRWAASWTLAHSDAFTGDCRAVRRQAVKLGMPSDRIFVFPWGVDLDEFAPGSGRGRREQAGIPPEAFVVLSTRPWAAAYGIGELVDGFIKAAPEMPGVHLWLLGRGPCESMIRRRLAEAGLTSRSHLEDPVSNQQMPMVYQASDLYLSASHSDGSSVSLLEAMACGLPALVSNIPGNREWVLPGENGWWFCAGDAGSVASGLLQAVRARSELAHMGLRSRQIAEERADWERNFQVLMQAYEFVAHGAS